MHLFVILQFYTILCILMCACVFVVCVVCVYEVVHVRAHVCA